MRFRRKPGVIKLCRLPSAMAAGGNWPVNLNTDADMGGFVPLTFCEVYFTGVGEVTFTLGASTMTQWVVDTPKQITIRGIEFSGFSIRNSGTEEISVDNLAVLVGKDVDITTKKVNVG